MKISVSNADLPVPISLSLPTGLMRSNFLWRTIYKNVREDEGARIRKYQPLITGCQEILEQYVRENGHFDLVDVETKDGTRILISI